MHWFWHCDQHSNNSFHLLVKKQNKIDGNLHISKIGYRVNTFLHADYIKVLETKEERLIGIIYISHLDPMTEFCSHWSIFKVTSLKWTKKFWLILDIIKRKRSLVLNHLKGISGANFVLIHRYMCLVLRNRKNWKPKLNNQMNGERWAYYLFIFTKDVFLKGKIHLQSRVSPTHEYALMVNHLKSTQAWFVQVN